MKNGLLMLLVETRKRVDCLHSGSVKMSGIFSFGSLTSLRPKKCLSITFPSTARFMYVLWELSAVWSNCNFSSELTELFFIASVHFLESAENVRTVSINFKELVKFYCMIVF